MNPPTATQVVAPRKSPARLRVLVADDSHDTVFTLTALLENEGYDVTGVYSGAAVIARMKSYAPDAIILDLEMPGMSGYAVAREIRSAHPESSPLLVAISGKWTTPAEKVLAHFVGFHAHLEKPADPAAIIRLLEARRAALNAGDAPAQAGFTTRPFSGPPTGAKVMVVDDDPSIRELLKLHLGNAGYQVALAEDAVVAGHSLLRAAPDLMIVDVDMPFLDGFSFVAALRQDPGFPQMPILFLTAVENAEERARALGAGYVRKPVFADALLRAVAQQLKPGVYVIS